MTTIVCTRDRMIADTQSTSGETAQRMQKIYRIRDSIIGVAGNLGSCMALLQWFEDRQRYQLPGIEDACAIILSPKGITYWINPFLRGAQIDADYYAIGSGAAHALGALAVGASPEDAVAAACSLDVYSSLPMQVELLKNKKRQPECQPKRKPRSSRSPKM